MKRRRRRLVGSVWVVTLGGLLVCCGRHVTVQAPLASAPKPERLRAYEDLRPVERNVLRGSRLSDDPLKRPKTSVATDFVRLGNGLEVHHVEDLLPVVPPDSEIAKDARSSVRIHRDATVATILGILVMSTAVVVDLARNSPRETFAAKNYALSMAGAAAGGFLIGLGTSLYVKSGHRASRAYTDYEPSLKRRLDLCDEGEGLVTCRHLPPVVP